MHVAYDNEKQGLIDAVAELQRKATQFDRKCDELDRKAAEYDRKYNELERKSNELDRKSAEYDRKFARLEKITKSLHQDRQQHRRGGDLMSYSSFMSEDDDSIFFSDHPKSLRTNTKKRSGGLLDFGHHDDEGSDQDHSLSLAIEGEVKDDEVAHIDMLERGDLRQEVHLLQEKVASLDEIVNKRSSNSGEEVNRRSLLTQLSATFLPSSSPDDSKKSIMLDRDTFTLMMRARWNTKPWFLGFISFLFQVVLLIFGPFNFYTTAGFIDLIPISAIDDGFLVVKYLVLALCLITQSDILSSVHSIIIMATLDTADLSTLIDEEELRMIQRRKHLWITRILIPNLLKIIQGLLVLVVTLMVVITSENSVDLLKDYTALLVISQIDNVMFYIAEYGFLGGDLAIAADKAKAANVEVEAPTTRRELIIKMTVMFALLSSLFGTFGYFVEGQQSGKYFKMQYPKCNISVDEISKIGDGECEAGIFNTIECDFDGGDCFSFNLIYPNCKAPEPMKIGDDVCDDEYNIPECNFDGNDCCPFDTENFTDPRYGDKLCDGGKLFATLCKLDNFDCFEFTKNAPKCDYEALSDLVPLGEEPRLGDGICESNIYNTPECLYENGDCEICNSKVIDYTLISDGICQGGPYNTFDCNYDASDCILFNKRWPGCEEETRDKIVDKMVAFPIIGDGICNSGLYNNENCGYEDGDCLFCNELVPDITKIGDGFCDGQQYMSDVCGYDGGDCIGCEAPRFEIGNDWCNPEYNTKECSYDSGDCNAFLNYTGCEVEFPSLLGNSHCNGGEYNTEECGYDGGDCIEFYIEGCDEPQRRHYLLGNGRCESFLNNEECEFDKGDCTFFNENFPECEFVGLDPEFVGDGTCHGGNYNTESCGWDGGDCLIEL